MTLNIVILALVTLQRVGELWLARRNTRRLLEQGAREHAPSHYPLIVAVHALWPKARDLAPKIRVVVDELVRHFAPTPAWDRL